jgi:hypothetical protein
MSDDKMDILFLAYTCPDRVACTTWVPFPRTATRRSPGMTMVGYIGPYTSYSPTRPLCTR